MVCFFTASEEAKRVIRGENTTVSESKPSASGESETTSNSPRQMEGWETLLSRFWHAEQSFCDERFKLIPSVVCIYSFLFIFHLYYES